VLGDKYEQEVGSVFEGEIKVALLVWSEMKVALCLGLVGTKEGK
jgi:hypothetical protein